MSTGGKSKEPMVKSEVTFLFDLIRDVAKNRIRVPRFPRPFVWTRRQMLDLLDSVRRQYPVGTLVFWETDEERPYMDRIGPVQVGPTETRRKNVLFVLDGHQRIATLAGTLLPRTDSPLDEEDSERWRVWYNAKIDDGRDPSLVPFEHIRTGEKPAPWHYPMSRLMDTIEIIKESERIRADGGQKAEVWIKRTQALARAFQQFQLPVVKILNADLSHAVNISTRLNSSGHQLSRDQLLSALTYREGANSFDLAGEIGETIALLKSRGFTHVTRDFVLRTVLAILEENIYETDFPVVGRSPQDGLASELPQAVETSRAALEQAVSLLQAFGIHNGLMLPYSMQVVVLAAFCSKCPAPTDDQKAFLRRWLWASSYQTWFATANPSQVFHLVEEFRDVVSSNPAPAALTTMDLDAPAYPFPRSFDMRGARTRTLLCRLVDLKPRRSDGHFVDEPWRLVKEHGPGALGRICATVDDKALRTSPANRLLSPDPTDRRQAKSWLVNLQPDADSDVLESHAIDPSTLELLKDGKHDEFLSARLQRLMELERRFMTDNGIILPKDEQPASSPVDTDDMDIEDPELF